MKNKLLFSLGIFIFLYGITAIIYSLYQGESSWIFWICYIGLVLIGIGALKKDEILIKCQLNILTIPLLIWTIDFIIILIFGNSLFNTSSYFFELKPFAKIISLEHLFLIPLGFTCLFLLKKQINYQKSTQPAQKLKQKAIQKSKQTKITLIISFIQIIFIFTLTRLLTSPSENVNCVFKSCTSLVPQTNVYFPSLLLISSVIILITNYFLDYVVISR